MRDGTGRGWQHIQTYTDSGRTHIYASLLLLLLSTHTLTYTHLLLLSTNTHSFYVVSLRAVKDFVAATDAYASVHLLRWHEVEPTHTIELLGKDYSPVVTAPPGGAQFVVDPPTLGVLVSDDRGNLQVLQYDPADVESRGGNRLVRRADFHLGHRLGFLQHARPGRWIVWVVVWVNLSGLVGVRE